MDVTGSNDEETVDQISSNEWNEKVRNFIEQCWSKHLNWWKILSKHISILSWLLAFVIHSYHERCFGGWKHTFSIEMKTHGIFIAWTRVLMFRLRTRCQQRQPFFSISMICLILCLSMYSGALCVYFQPKIMLLYICITVCTLHIYRVSSQALAFLIIWKIERVLDFE